MNAKEFINNIPISCVYLQDRPGREASNSMKQVIPTDAHHYYDQIRLDDWVEDLPSQRRLQFICYYVILLLRISIILFVLSSFHVVFFCIW